MQIAGLSDVGFSLLYFIYLIIPGFLGLKAYLLATREIDYLSRFDKLAFAAVIGVATVVVPLLAYGESCASSNLSFCHPLDSLTFNNLSSFPILFLLFGIMLQSAGAFVAGLIIGTAKNHLGRKPKRNKADKDRPWRYAFGHRVPLQKLSVKMKGGNIVKGKLLRYGSGPEDYDLLIADPEIIDGNGTQVGNPDGYRYIHNDAISEIQFHGVTYPIGDERFIWQRIRGFAPIRLLYFLVHVLISLGEWVKSEFWRMWEETKPKSGADEDD